MEQEQKQQVQWEKYWHETRTIARSSLADATSIWDSDPEQGADVDVTRFAKYADPSLPVHDVGCGNGTQTARLTRYFKRVIGTDVSESAVALASQTASADNLSYEVLDALSLSQAEAFHRRHGDVNLYVRTVVHPFNAQDRHMLGRVLQVLMGERGTMYMMELGDDSPAYFESWIQQHGLPHKLARVISTGLRPGPVGRGDVDTMFPPADYEVVSDGVVLVPGARMTSDKLDAEGRPEGATWEPPMYYAVVRHRTKH